MKESYLKKLLWSAVILGVILGIHFIFNFDGLGEWLGVMTISFLFGVPFLIGVLTVRFGNKEDRKSILFRIFMPWVPVIGFLAVTLLFALEGWACWAMALPLFLFFSSLGGIFMGFLIKRTSSKTTNLNISLLMLLPFIAAPIEHAVGPTLSTFEAYTYIDIEAAKGEVWPHVTRVYNIAECEDTGWLGKRLGIPRPLYAELDFEGINARREAVFSGGVVFDEVVTAYAHEELMTFTISANAVDIPSTTFDEHVLIGGEYFDVLEGKYALETLENGNVRLHLSSTFKLNTTFNFYAGVWASWIMKDIQNNILRVIKKRSEA